MRTDTDRFKTILALELFDGLEGVEKSLFEYQLDQAMAHGGKEPNEDDELNGLRMMLDEYERLKMDDLL